MHRQKTKKQPEERAGHLWHAPPSAADHRQPAVSRNAKGAHTKCVTIAQDEATTTGMRRASNSEAERIIQMWVPRMAAALRSTGAIAVSTFICLCIPTAATAQTEPKAEPTPAATSESQKDAPVTVVAPKVKTSVAPTYPEAARSDGQTSRVVLKVRV
ncbi:MAG: hypothetical protein VX223_12820, partial [Myxococcota bacterium]|nr:hypothetical protein [Myxococcota bacterium]